jgi:hypothetical protein
MTTSLVPEEFRIAVASLSAVRARPEVEVSQVKPPQKLAPHAHALSAEANGPAGELATGNLVLLHNPEGAESWGGGFFRLVAYVRAEVDAELAADPLLPAVGWSWLTEALELNGARWTALGGTVTQASSARFGDIAGPARTDDMQLRASWTALDPQLGSHAQAFYDLMAQAAGLPPVGVSVFPPRAGS